MFFLIINHMKKIFIYYSHTGNGDLIAERYKEMGYNIRKVIPKKDLPKSFFWGVMTGGFLAGLNHKSKLVNYDSDLSDYDEVVIGTPIWNGKLSCPINMVLKQTNLKGKKLTFILYSGSGSAPKAIKKLNKKYTCEIIELQEPKKYKENLEKIK